MIINRNPNNTEYAFRIDLSENELKLLDIAVGTAQAILPDDSRMSLSDMTDQLYEYVKSEL